MQLGGPAKYLCTITSRDELLEAVAFAKTNKLIYRIIGYGSNIIWSDDGFDGLVIVNDIQGFKITDQQVEIGSGVVWDDAVKRCVSANLSGIEFLSLIPGTTGATPVQNVGAYGAEISDLLVSLQAFDTNSSKFVTLSNNECGFGYRTSRFKREDAGRFMITQITLQLSRESPTPPFYESLQNYFNQKKINKFTPQVIRDAVITIRSSKLPDPDKVANNGSFFANPVISQNQYIELVKKFPNLKSWQHGGKQKISAAWLVEQAGYKNHHDPKTGMSTWSKQTLVLVNEHATSTDDLLKYRDEIIKKVQTMFSITLEQEPELL